MKCTQIAVVFSTIVAIFCSSVNGGFGTPYFFHMTFLAQIDWSNHQITAYGWPQSLNTSLVSSKYGPIFENTLNITSVDAAPAVWTSTFTTRKLPASTIGVGTLNENASINFGGGDVISFQTFGFSGYEAQNLQGWQGNMGGATYSVNGKDSKGKFSGGRGVCNAFWTTPFNQCTFKIRVSCGVWVGNSDFQDGKPHEETAPTNLVKPNIPDWAMQDPEAYRKNNFPEDANIPSQPNVPGPNNTIKVEFFFGPLPLDGGNRLPAHDVGFAASQYTIVDLNGKGVPKVETTFYDTNVTLRYSSFVFVAYNGSQPAEMYGEAGYIDFGNGNLLDFSTLGLSGHFGVNNGNYGAQFFVLSGGRGVFEKAIGVMSTQWQSPGTSVFGFYIWGCAYIPAGNVPNPPTPVQIPSKSC